MTSVDIALSTGGLFVGEVVDQQGRGLISWMKSHPYMMAGMLMAAIAIPLALVDGSLMTVIDAV